MRLLNTENRELKNFVDDNIPLYAILSHTWGDDEITFQDVECHKADKKAGYEKIRRTCSIAAVHGFEYVWVDTCCIDKTSSAELSEAINSMYRWYQEAGVCYVYLADVPSNAADRQTRATSTKFLNSKWFTRGWTLQELIAPSIVIFLDQEWQEIGTKSSLQSIISEITSIPDTILQGGNLESASVAQKMSWASYRKTTRIEDIAYCLIGIFGVNMPMLYGEGNRAFIRLQEEIMKISDDHSLFAWASWTSLDGILAPSPDAFISSGNVVPLDSLSTLSRVITVNNKGVHLNLRFMDTDRKPQIRPELAILPCAVRGELLKMVGIRLEAISESEEYFKRTVTSPELELIDLDEIGLLKYPERKICVRRERQTQKNQLSLPKITKYGNKVVVKLLLEKGAALEFRDSFGWTLLSSAAENGNVEMVKLLLEEGSDLESKDYIGRTPLSHAAENGNKEMAKLLLEKGADLESKDVFGHTPLSQAVVNGNMEMAKLLLEKGADLESKDISGLTPLSQAAKTGNEEMAKLLLEKGADLESKDISGLTPPSQAAKTGNGEMAKLLLEKRKKSVVNRGSMYGAL